MGPALTPVSDLHYYAHLQLPLSGYVTACTHPRPFTGLQWHIPVGRPCSSKSIQWPLEPPQLSMHLSLALSLLLALPSSTMCVPADALYYYTGPYSRSLQLSVCIPLASAVPDLIPSCCPGRLGSAQEKERWYYFLHVSFMFSINFILAYVWG